MSRIKELAQELNAPEPVVREALISVVESMKGTNSDIADPLAEYRPWLREGQAWRDKSGRAGELRWDNRFGGWKFYCYETLIDVQVAGGRPVGTVWDLLNSYVQKVEVRGKRVRAVMVHGGSTYPIIEEGRLSTALPPGWHDRPRWAKSQAEGSNDG